MIQPANLLKQELKQRSFPLNLTKLLNSFFYSILYRSPPADCDYLCFASLSEILVKKVFWMILQFFRNISVSTVTIAISTLLFKNVQIPSMLLTAWSSSEKICPLSKRLSRYWHIPEILWKRSVYPDYSFLVTMIKVSK